MRMCEHACMKVTFTTGDGYRVPYRYRGVGWGWGWVGHGGSVNGDSYLARSSVTERGFCKTINVSQSHHHKTGFVFLTFEFCSQRGREGPAGCC